MNSPPVEPEKNEETPKLIDITPTEDPASPSTVLTNTTGETQSNLLKYNILPPKIPL